jgi:hypothetical protein
VRHRGTVPGGTDRAPARWYRYRWDLGFGGAGMSIRGMGRSACLAVALLVLSVAAGCGGPTGQGEEDAALQAQQSQQAPGAPGPGAPEESGGSPGAPGGPDDEARAPGSPITVPPFQQIGGQPVDKVRQEIEDAIRQACTPRHDLCVTTVVKPRQPGGGLHECFGGTDPPTFPDSARLDRGAVLTVYSEPGACEPSEPAEESSSSSTTGSSDTGQAPPSSGTESSGADQPDDAQPPPSS